MTVRQVTGRVTTLDGTPVEGATVTAQIAPETIPGFAGVSPDTVVYTTSPTDAEGVWAVEVTSDCTASYMFSTLVGSIVISLDGKQAYPVVYATISHGDGSPMPLTDATDPEQLRTE